MGILPPATRLLAPLYAHTFLVQAVTFVLRPTAVYRAIELDVPASWLGALGASFALVPLVLAVPAGHAADRFGERAVMLLGGLLTLLSVLCFVLVAHEVWGVVAGSVLLGTGHLGSVVGQQALVANRTPRAGYDTAFGHYTFVASAGQALGPLLIVFFGGSRTLPDTGAIFTGSLALAAVLSVTSFLVPGGRAEAGGKEQHAGTVRDLLRRPGLVRALTVSCVVLAAVDITIVYLPVLGAERDIAAGTIGALLAVRAAASMVSRLFLGRLVRRLGRGRLLTGSIVLAALGTALVALPGPVWLLAPLVVAMGFGLGTGQPLTMSWLAEATPPGLRGRAMSLRLTGNRLGQTVVPSAAGALAVGAGAPGVLVATAVALAAAGTAARGITQSPPSTP
ncbi:MFS transporter [Streptomyces sp. NPDC058665]|uniref:MFS transporter n=1 Tax=Streptomyces sp. NPDC058665 TaxID=3346586 RepID=UPI00365A1E69